MKSLSAALLLFAALGFAPSHSTAHSSNDPQVSQTHTIVQIAAADGRFDTLVAAVKATGLAETLSGNGPFTLFAPTDAAFAALPAGTVESLLRPENQDQLVSILTYHVIAGRIKAGDLLATGSAKTALGQSLPFGLSIGGATIVQTDITAENGIIHVIDAVLLPPADDAALAEMSSEERKTARESRRVIELAVDRGAPLYNMGQEAACAAVYEVASVALLANADLATAARDALLSGLERASRTHSPEDQAWRLREGLDAAYASLGRRMMSPAAGR